MESEEPLLRSQAPQHQERPCYFCCNFEEKQQDEAHRPDNHPAQQMPMLTRGAISTIKFRNLRRNNQQPIYELLGELYERHHAPSEIYQLLANKRINPVIESGGASERDDLEYFVPQIITYMVIEQNLRDGELAELVVKGCTTDFYFAHRVYFYLKSLTQDHRGEEIRNVSEFLEGEFLERMTIYQECKLSGIQFAKSMVQMDVTFKEKEKFEEEAKEYQRQSQEAQSLTLIPDPLPPAERHNSADRIEGEKYGTNEYPKPLPVNPRRVNKVYRKRYCQHGFMETPQFWDDLIQVGNVIGKTMPAARDQKLEELLMEVNERLPANVYIPFFKEKIRLYNVLCIWKGRLFSTKERAPYSIWMEIYREDEELNLERVQEKESQQNSKKKKQQGILEKISAALSQPFSISMQRNTLNFKDYIHKKLKGAEKSLKKSKLDKKSMSRSFAAMGKPIAPYYEDMMETSNRAFTEGESVRSSLNDQHLSEHTSANEYRLDDFFGGTEAEEQMREIKSRSIYRGLRSWRVVNLMVKTGDDIKQEQFAMQLINRFQYVFEQEKVDCVVFPYEVISLGPDCGLIEMLSDITTMSSLLRKIDEQSIEGRKMTLRDFFNRVYPDPTAAKRNFMRSLAGYSVMTYFLQVKDRHNGNILINRQGCIMHIDFGFFLSNAPGKGVELEKKVPFKLLSSYVEVLGGPNSMEFLQFRHLFTQGFRAVLKHKESFLTLVRLMYSSHGESMGCFIKGEAAIDELEERFAISEGVHQFCHELINSSLDNWRARWYDKFQYYFQRIYY